MFEFIAALIVIALAILGMSLRFIACGRHLKRSCGGITNLKKFMGFTPCELCTKNTANCRRRSTPSPD
ncbi:hypothetical protein ORJ04_18650 [Rheinheimera baltica]|uniref:(Na+)-NQR maturation NqrM n=1 Tax=Rheinheimera baltica TaxID=67576 RepID=A0ABT9I4F4_9GAMM|nr:hypothetical protein [Rheinheimera baltica]MDP5137973.1 hypothetical protein [Rheinheimera baltica]